MPPSSHLFVFKDFDGVFIPMCKSLFLARCNKIWSSTSLSCLGGHSFCIGGTTHLLLIGVDPFIIMVQGRWKSTAFLEYWCNCEEIILTFIVFFLSYKSSVLASMSSFKQCLMRSLSLFSYGESVLQRLFTQLIWALLYGGVITPSQPCMQRETGQGSPHPNNSQS